MPVLVLNKWLCHAKMYNYTFIIPVHWGHVRKNACPGDSSHNVMRGIRRQQSRHL